MAEQMTSCPTCGYPVMAHFEGETLVCANCGQKMEVISQGISIPTPVFIGLLSFAAGMLFGPPLIASTKAGQDWLTRQARGG
jgi:hypothetical protein